MKTQKEASLNELMSVVRAALLAGGRQIEQGAKRARKVSFKTPLSPVTQVDIASEKAVVAVIRRRFPDHLFLSEEMAHFDRRSVKTKKSDHYRWIIDPLDGTVNFVHRIPQSCVSVAVEKEGIVWAGGVYDPYRKELFTAVRGRGAFLNGRRIRVSSVTRLKKSLVITGFPYDRSDNANHYLDFLKPFLRQCADLRRFGAAALDLAWIACGRAEGYLEYKLAPWDVAAGSLLVEEAGGRISDFKGRPLDLDRPFATLASNGQIHPALIRLL